MTGRTWFLFRRGDGPEMAVDCAPSAPPDQRFVFWCDVLSPRQDYAVLSPEQLDARFAAYADLVLESSR